MNRDSFLRESYETIDNDRAASSARRQFEIIEVIDRITTPHEFHFFIWRMAGPEDRYQYITGGRIKEASMIGFLRKAI